MGSKKEDRVGLLGKTLWGAVKGFAFFVQHGGADTFYAGVDKLSRAATSALNDAIERSDRKIELEMNTEPNEDIYSGSPSPFARTSSTTGTSITLQTFSPRSELQKSPSAVKNTKLFEPILGVETKALVKRAFIFMSDGEFDEAERYIEQALRQDPENSFAYIGKLMAELGVHDTDELCGISSPLKEQKLFRRALSFANEEERILLEGYIEANEKNLEMLKQAQLEKEYQRILRVKESLSTSANAQLLLNSLKAIVPYKDSEALIQEVSQIKQKFEVLERKYAEAYIEKRAVERQKELDIERINKAAGMFDALGGYKDCKSLAEGLRRFASDKAAEAKRRKIFLKCFVAAVIIAVIAVCVLFGYKKISAYTAVRNEEKSRIGIFVSMAEKNMSKSELDEIIRQVKKGDAKVQSNLGDMYFAGKAVSQDYGQAFYWYTKSAEQGNSEALCGLGKFYLGIDGFKQDFEKALYFFNKSAEQGNANVQYELGKMYYDGKGIKQDYEKALSWYTRSAEQGNVNAQNMLVWMYHNGQGIKQDYERALHWCTKSAEQGNADSQNRLGVMYFNGEGTKQDYEKALYWFTKSAEQNQSYAQSNIALVYFHGQGVQQDYGKALYWYTRSAEQGNVDAQNHLGLMYHDGQGIKQDYEKALYWYAKSAEQGNVDAQHNLDVLSEILRMK